LRASNPAGEILSEAEGPIVVSKTTVMRWTIPEHSPFLPLDTRHLSMSIALLT